MLSIYSKNYAWYVQNAVYLLTVISHPQVHNLPAITFWTADHSLACLPHPLWQSFVLSLTSRSLTDGSDMIRLTFKMNYTLDTMWATDWKSGEAGRPNRRLLQGSRWDDNDLVISSEGGKSEDIWTILRRQDQPGLATNRMEKCEKRKSQRWVLSLFSFFDLVDSVCEGALWQQQVLQENSNGSV